MSAATPAPHDGHDHGGWPVGQAPSDFRRRYDADPDPWGFDSRWYERRKQAVTVALLPNERYERAVEPGCANGALTARLAERCDELDAFDFVPEVVAHARRRLLGTRHVQLSHAVFPSYWPAGDGDLVVWSEVAYYLDGPRWVEAIDGLRGWLRPGGDLVAVHHTGDTDHPRTAEDVHAALDEVPWLERLVDHTDAGFVAGVWRRAARQVTT